MPSAICHPEKKAVAKGICGACYKRKQREDPIKKARQYAANKEWHIRHPEYERERARIRWATNPAPLRTAHKNYALRYPEKLRAFKKAWIDANPEKHRAQMRSDVKRRKARKKGAAISDFTAVQWEQMKIDHKFACFYCGTQSEFLQQEHCIPLSRGGNHTKSNIVPACGPCNRQKYVKTMEEYQLALEAS